MLASTVAASGDQGKRLQQVMLEAYRSIGDPDALYGCGAGATLATAQARLAHFPLVCVNENSF